MDIHIVSPNDYRQIHQLRDYCFPNKYTGARREDFHYWIEQSTTLGAYDHKKIVGQLLILPLNMTVHGVPYKMGGIGFVATYPEYRQQGIIKRLMIEALQKMRDNGQTISVLAPFSVSFYRHFGWELFFEKLHYTIPQAQFPSFGKQLDIVKRMSFEWVEPELFKEIKDFHNIMAILQNGGMVRDDAWWKRIERRSPDSHFAAYFQADKIEGYIRYTIQQGTFVIQDFIVANYLAEQAIWRYITSHAASVDQITGVTSNHYPFGFYFKEPQFKREVIQDVMVRVVDVAAFMQQYPWGDITETLTIRIDDSFCHWNEHVYQINKNGQVSIIETNSVSDKHMLTLPINLFSAMMVGYLSVKEAVVYANQSTVEKTLQRWQRALPTEKPAFYEYF
ncbi:GNAT family N-acetyltransferase [Lysinibacillus fusiformis]|uniref:GNAT family N-acetyltransferase n=1 Tax=Lysinibacillus fusiformis TaxID=28031 RepID=A0A2I0V1E7_9BACI|nr:GNAT family N-acetyltransferase [Lysinibacillus fusiformis]PKU52115.1 GNAT family N-acetyltransferase [Lysinibacillus fusiformis]